MYSRTGVARLALDKDVPVLPVARWGTQGILDGYHKKFRPFPRHDVITAIGEPVDLSDYREQPVTTQAAARGHRPADGRVTSLVAQIRGETPPAERSGRRRRRKPSSPGEKSDDRAARSRCSVPVRGAPRSPRCSPTRAGR